MKNQKSLTDTYIKQLAEEVPDYGTITVLTISDDDSGLRMISTEDSSSSSPTHRGKRHVGFHIPKQRFRGRKPYQRPSFLSWLGAKAFCCTPVAYKSTTIEHDGYKLHNFSPSQLIDESDFESTHLSVENLRLKNQTSLDFPVSCESAINDVLLLGQERSNSKNINTYRARPPDVKKNEKSVPSTIDLSVDDKYIVPMIDMLDHDAIESSRSTDANDLHIYEDRVRDKKNQEKVKPSPKSTEKSLYNMPPSMIEIEQALSAENGPESLKLYQVKESQHVIHSSPKRASPSKQPPSPLESTHFESLSQEKVATRRLTPKLSALLEKDEATKFIIPRNDLNTGSPFLPNAVKGIPTTSSGFSMQVKKGLKAELTKKKIDNLDTSSASKRGAKSTISSEKKIKDKKEKTSKMNTTLMTMSSPKRDLRENNNNVPVLGQIHDTKVRGCETPHTSSSTTAVSTFSSSSYHMKLSSGASTVSSTTKRIFTSDSKSEKWFGKATRQKKRRSHPTRKGKKGQRSLIKVSNKRSTLGVDDLDSSASWEVVLTINSKGKKTKKASLPTPITKLLGDFNELSKEPER